MRIPMFCLMLATLAIAPSVSPVFAQSRAVFVLPTLDDPTLNPTTTSQPPLYAPSNLEASVLGPAPFNASLNPDPLPNSRRHVQPEISPELKACRKRYADAVYNIGLALWTAPPVQHRALERLLNAASAVQSVANDPKTTVLNTTLCSDSTLTTLEATVVRLKAKGWVPLTPVEEHVVHTANLGDELKRALEAIWR